MMKRGLFAIAILSAFLVASCPSTAMALILQESYNESDTPYGGEWYATQVALQYTPTASYDLSRVEFFTGGAKDDVTISLRPDAGGSPGTTILASGMYDSVYGNSWQGATFSSPYSVVSGTTYWVTWYNTQGLTAPYSSGITRTVRWGIASNPDDYPSPYGDLGFMTKFYGEGGSAVPEPATMALVGMGLAGALGLRKRK